MNRDQIEMHLKAGTVNLIGHSLAHTAIDALARLEDAEGRLAAAEGRVAALTEAGFDVLDADERGQGIQFSEAMVKLMAALADPSGVEALAALRAERDHWEVLAIARDANQRRAQAERDDALTRLAAAEGQVGALREAADFLRTTIRKNIIEREGPHTIELPDGTIHSGPVVDFLHRLLPMIAEVLDRAALATVTPPADTGEGA